MITAIEIANFKGIGKCQRIELKPITLLFGPNSAGKSTVLHAMQYAFEVLDRHNLDADRTQHGGEYVDLGGFRNFVHRRQFYEPVRLYFELDLSRSNLPELFPIEEYLVEFPGAEIEDLSTVGEDAFSGWVELLVNFSDDQGIPYVTRYSVGLDGQTFATLLAGPPDQRGESFVTLHRLNLIHPILAWTREQKGRREHSAGLLDWVCPGLRMWPLNGYYQGHYGPGESLSEGDLEEKLAEDDQHRVWQAGPIDEFEAATLRSCTIWAEVADEGSTYEVVLGRRIEDDRIAPAFIRFPRSDYWTPDNVQQKIVWAVDPPLAEVCQRTPLKGQTDALPSLTGRIQVDTEASSDFSDQMEEIEDEGATAFAFALLSRLIIGPGRLLRDNLENLRYVGPLRRTVPRHYEPPRFSEVSDWADGLGAWSALLKSEDGLVGKVSSWLADSDKLDTGYELRPQKLYEVDSGHPFWAAIAAGTFFDEGEPEDARESLLQSPLRLRIVIVDTRTGQELQSQDIGEGIAQVVPVITAALAPPDELRRSKVALAAIEQPELHLHPRQQAALGDLLIEGAISAGVGSLLVETHSEHLILRILRRVRETAKRGSGTAEGRPEGQVDVLPEHIAVLYVEQCDGATTLTEIGIDHRGEFLRPWPDSFFEQGFLERFA